MQSLELYQPVIPEYESILHNFIPRKNGREFEWRDIRSGKFFVIKIHQSSNLTGQNETLLMATMSLCDFRGKRIFSLTYGSINGEKPRANPLMLSAADDLDQYAPPVWSHDVLSHMDVDYSLEGDRRGPSGFYYDWGSKYDFLARGHYTFSSLPEHINVNATIESFRQQLQNGDFSQPKLIQ